jgi:hypothetical protein
MRSSLTTALPAGTPGAAKRPVLGPAARDGALVLAGSCPGFPCGDPVRAGMRSRCRRRPAAARSRRQERKDTER